jgi:asparaginyl-tRNA synthetase
MIEPEIAFADLSDNAALAEALLKYTLAALLKQRQEDLAFFDQRIEKGLVAKLRASSAPNFVHIDCSEAIEVLERSHQNLSSQSSETPTLLWYGQPSNCHILNIHSQL